MTPASGEARAKRSVEHLQTLYTVMVGLALAVGMEGVLRHGAAPSQISSRSVVLMVALLVTLVPFYHGTQRHLDDEYGLSNDPGPASWILLFDFAFLFLEACVFLALGAGTERTDLFAWTFVALLTVDIIWVISAELLRRIIAGERLREAIRIDRAALRARPGAPAPTAPINWVRTNLVAISVASVVLLAWAPPQSQLVWIVLALAILRSAADYATSWEWYLGSLGCDTPEQTATQPFTSGRALSTTSGRRAFLMAPYGKLRWARHGQPDRESD
jgi:hypothetical protein